MLMFIDSVRSTFADLKGTDVGFAPFTCFLAQNCGLIVLICGTLLGIL